MVADLLFPSRRPLTPYAADRFAARQRFGRRVAVPLDLGVALRDPQLRRPLGQRGEVGDRHVRLHQLGQCLAEAFGLAVRQAKQLAQRQQGFHGQIAVHERPTDLRGGVVVLPSVDHARIKPQRHVAATHQRLVILAPILDFGNTFSPWQPSLRSVGKQGKLHPCPIYAGFEGIGRQGP